MAWSRQAVSIAAMLASVGGSIALAQQTVPVEKVVSTADNGGFVPASGSLDGTQTWLKRSNSAMQGEAPTIDGSGNVAFSATLTAGVGGVVGGPFDSGTHTPPWNQLTFWYGGPGSLSLQARYGDATLDNANCGGSGAIFTSRYTPRVAISPSGYMLISASGITGGTTTTADRNVMWVGTGGNFHNFVRAGDVYTNVGSSRQSSNITSAQSSTRLNNLGQAPFQATNILGVGDTTNNPPQADPPANNQSWIGVCSPGMSIGGTNAGGVKVVRLRDDPLGTGSMVNGWGDSAFNHSGTVFNTVSLTSVGSLGGVTASDSQLLMQFTPSGGGYAGAILGRANGPTGVGAIEYAAGSAFWTFVDGGVHLVNNGGRLLWTATLKEGVGGIDATNSGAVFTRKDGVTSLVVQKGPASAIDAGLPGLLSGFAGVRLSNNDQVAWVGKLAGTGINTTNDQFLAVSTIAPDASVTHRLILREGEQVADGPPGLLWGGHSQSQYPGPGGVGINASGIVVFTCYLQGTGITDNVNDWSAWAYFPSCGKVRKVAQYGDAIGGLTVQYTAWNTSANGEGSTVGFNDEGWLAFLAYDGVNDGAIMRAHFCPADLDDGTGNAQPDGGVDINDLLYFLAQYEGGQCGADLDNGSGTGLPDAGVDINDLLFFLAHYEGGC